MEASNAEFTRYISGEEICSKHQLVPSQLLELVRQGMTPVYSLSGIPLIHHYREDGPRLKDPGDVTGEVTDIVNLSINNRGSFLADSINRTGH